MMTKSVLVITFLVLGLLACSGDDDPVKDTGIGDGLGDMFKPDTIGAIEDFGKACDNIGQQCKQGSSLFPLWCVAVAGGASGKGYCTPQCTDIGNECYNVPNGQMAGCFIEDTSKGDAGPATKYCGFLCKMDPEGPAPIKTWTCPGELKCGKTNAQGQAICLP